MARKRLTPIASPMAPPSPAPVDSTSDAPLETKAFGLAQTVRREPPPIARVAGETAAEAALATLSAEVAQARDEGRLIVVLKLEEIAEGYLIRDRVDVDEAEMNVLMTSLTQRGQQTAIEVIDLGAERNGQGARYGLISGWRRLMALRRLREQTGEARFASVKALVRRPETASDAYRAMVDENEIRVGLSYWERARIAVRAAEIGLYPTVQLALRDLYASASRAKRSKIGSFVRLYAALGESVRFPAAMGERQGLQLTRALEENPDLAGRLSARLAAAAAADAGAEQAVLTGFLTEISEATPGRGKTSRAGQGGDAKAAGTPARRAPAMFGGPAAAAAPGGVQLVRRGPDCLMLEGAGADPAFEADLAAWLARRLRRE